MAAIGEETRAVLAKAARQALRFETLAKLEILKAKNPAKYVRLMYLEALRRAIEAQKRR